MGELWDMPGIRMQDASDVAVAAVAVNVAPFVLVEQLVTGRHTRSVNASDRVSSHWLALHTVTRAQTLSEVRVGRA